MNEVIRKIKYSLFSVYHWLMSFFGALFYGFPSRKIKVIGITGTKGKSTTLAILSDIFEKAGIKTAFISSVDVKKGDDIEKNTTGNSMPGRFFIQKFLSDSALKKCQVALVEVTSQGVAQHRHRFIFWDGAVFLDIHPEHIEAHGSFENYLQAKLSFFDYASSRFDSKIPKFFVNTDDKYAEKFVKASKNFPVIRFSRDSLDIFKIKLPQALSADFMKTNVSAAAMVAENFGVSAEDIKSAIENFQGVKGRMEVVIKSRFTAIVDYAHTPDSLEAVYNHLKNKKHKENQLICVLGSAGGGRDKWKRSKMGEIAALYCDKIILTNEDPYDENPIDITNKIKSGVLSQKFSEKNIFEILDRKEAIKKAVSLADKNDIVICTGKGSEEFIHIKNGEKIKWSDREALLGVLEENK